LVYVWPFWYIVPWQIWQPCFHTQMHKRRRNISLQFQHCRTSALSEKGWGDFLASYICRQNKFKKCIAVCIEKWVSPRVLSANLLLSLCMHKLVFLRLIWTSTPLATDTRYIKPAFWQAQLLSEIFNTKGRGKTIVNNRSRSGNEAKPEGWQGDQMPSVKKSPKMKPNPFLSK
jgi:hypothetical protein